jgi:hypothetical protein
MTTKRSHCSSEERLMSYERGVDHAVRRQANVKGWRVVVLYTDEWQKAKTEAQKFDVLATALA